MTWERGRDAVARLVDAGDLERVAVSDEVARRLLEYAEAHMALAGKGLKLDPAGALHLSYDAARKACAALLAVQGLRATSRGGHVVVIETVRAQFGDRGAFKVFDRLHRLRRRRNASEYLDPDSPTVTDEDARQALTTARDTVEAVRRLIGGGQLDRFE